MKRRSSLHFVIILSHVVCLRSQAKSFVPHCITVFLRIYGSGLPLLYFLASIFMFLQPLSWAKMPWSMPKGVWFGVVRKAVAAEQLIISYSYSESCEVNASFHCFILLQMSFRLIFRLWSLWSLWSFRLSSSNSQVLGRQVQPSVGCQEAPQPCSILKHSNIFEQNMFEYNMSIHVIFHHWSTFDMFWFTVIMCLYMCVRCSMVLHHVFKKMFNKVISFFTSSWLWRPPAYDTKMAKEAIDSMFYVAWMQSDATPDMLRYALCKTWIWLCLTCHLKTLNYSNFFEPRACCSGDQLAQIGTGAIICVIFCYHIQVHIVSQPWLGLVMRTVRLN